jgi:hypothetical protein
MKLKMFENYSRNHQTKYINELFNFFDKKEDNFDVEKYCNTYLKNTDFEYKIYPSNDEYTPRIIIRKENGDGFSYSEIEKNLKLLVTFIDRDKGIKNISFRDSFSGRVSRSSRYKFSTRDFLKGNLDEIIFKTNTLRDIKIFF